MIAVIDNYDSFTYNLAHLFGEQGWEVDVRRNDAITVEEARALEMHERLVTHERGRLQPAQIMAALTVRGHESLGWTDAGVIEAGRRADLVAVRLDTPRTAGSRPDQVLLAAGAADVHTVVIDGRIVVRDGAHLRMDVGAELAREIGALWAVA